MRASTFAEQIALEEIDHGEFKSRYLPEAMGNTANIAYGGCTLAISIAAAGKTVDKAHSLYSAHGNYLSPVSTGMLLHASVRRIRDTKTFSTRLVEIYQEPERGSKRLCLIMTADYMVTQSPSVLEYSAAPVREFTDVEDSRTWTEIYDDLLGRRLVGGRVVASHQKTFELAARYFDQRLCLNGFSTQTLYGLAKSLETSQDHLPLASRTSMDWFKTRHPAKSLKESMAALAFQMDGAMAFLPFTHNHQFIDEVGACSSLDFALRVFTAQADLNDWLLKEMRTLSGGDQRTYTEARLWDRSGRLVANMTQQCILRPKPATKPNL